MSENGRLNMDDAKLIELLTEGMRKSSEVVAEKGSESENRKLSESERKQAAYALNMCTVSVSQIIDYDDINVLEQEYETILNNINLEHVPKDEALLNILKQLLDTITYFRIQEQDKKMIDLEYQHKIKNAIWSAVPNFGLIVAGGNPLTMAVSLASQVGIGYMNYRRNKAEYAFDKERQMWQLQRTAIEQFNGLRRELFNTAWRLADTYGFEDKLRLTEKQIKQYNQILTDPDKIRKLERMEVIKANFEAYPPFWYFIGNVASSIAWDRELRLSDTARQSYRKKALTYFKKYEETNELELLREDQIASSCALEHVDLLLLEDKPDVGEIKKLLLRAIELSGNSNDVIELCAIAFLKINDQENAAHYLRILVNEGYNKIINAQLLSSIYVRNNSLEDYELLAVRVDVDYLFPFPEKGCESPKELEESFISKIKYALKLKYKYAFENLLQKYSIEWNRITTRFEVAEAQNDSFFMDTAKANARRRNVARQVFANSTMSYEYSGRMSQVNYELEMLDILNRLCDGVFSLSTIQNTQVIEEVEEEIRNQLVLRRASINNLQKQITEGNCNLNVYNLTQTFPLRLFVGRALNALVRYIGSLIDKASMDEVFGMESDLRRLCMNQKIKEPELTISHSALDNSFGESDEFFGPEIFGRQAILAKKNAAFLAEMSDYVKGMIKESMIKGNSLRLYYLGEPEFNSFFLDSAFNSCFLVKSHSLLVMKDNSGNKTDLVFTTKGIVCKKNNSIKSLTAYNDVRLSGDYLILSDGLKYSTNALDTRFLFHVVQELGRKFIVGIEDKIEYIAEPLTSKLLVDWFRKNSISMESNVTKVIAFPTKEILNHLGYLDAEIDERKNLIQYYYDNETNDLLGMRIVRFENIESNLQSKLLEANGFLKVQN